MFKKVKKVVFPVAGMGTRFLPATKAMPKEVLPIVDKPLIQYAVEEALASGITEILFVTGYGKSAIENHFDRSYELESELSHSKNHAIIEEITKFNGVNIFYTRQGKALGLGHAVNCAKEFVGNDPFAVILADDIFAGEKACLKHLTDIYPETGGNLVSVEEVPLEHVSRYGVIAPGETKDAKIQIKGLVEKPNPKDAPSNLAICGRYILQPEIFDYLSENSTGVGGEIQLTDSMEKLLQSQPFHAVRFEGKRFDCGSKLGWLEANIAFALERPELKGDLLQIMQAYIDKQG